MSKEKFKRGLVLFFIELSVLVSSIAAVKQYGLIYEEKGIQTVGFPGAILTFVIFFSFVAATYNAFMLASAFMEGWEPTPVLTQKTEKTVIIKRVVTEKRGHLRPKKRRRRR